MYNAQDFVGGSVRSITEQTFADLEVVVVDDGSTDASVEEVLRVADGRIRLVRGLTNRGQSEALNTGLRMARGRYVAILGADDVALPDRIATQARYLDEHPDTGLVGTSYARCDESGAVFDTFHVPEHPTAILWRLLLSNPIGAPTVMMRRDVFERAGYFDPFFVFAEDLEYWGRVASVVGIDQIDVPLTAYRVHERSLSSATPDAIATEAVARAHQNNVRRLTDLELGLDSLAVLAGGAPSSDAELLAAYDDLDALAAAFIRRYARDAGLRRLVLAELALVVVRLARVNDQLRLRAVRSIARYARNAGLGVVVSPQLWSLVVRVLPPRGARELARRTGRACEALRSWRPSPRNASPG